MKYTRSHACLLLIALLLPVLAATGAESPDEHTHKLVPSDLEAQVKKWPGTLPTASVPTEIATEATKSPPITCVTFTWIDQHAGDCHLSGVLTLYSDGRAHWDATTWTDSTHGKDVWHETLRVYNAQKKEIFGFGVWDSPQMDSPPKGGQYHWTQDGAFPASLYNQIASALSHGEC